MISLWKGKNPIYFGVITIIPFDNLFRRAYFVMHTFLVCNILKPRYMLGKIIIHLADFLGPGWLNELGSWIT